MIHNYYLPFIPAAKVDYYFLFSLIEVSEYNINAQSFSDIKYLSLQKLADNLCISHSQLNRKLSDIRYNDFFTIDKQNKVITINNSFSNSNKQFIMLSHNDISYLRKHKSDMLCKLFIYLKYYATKEKINSTQEQILSAIGYKSNSGDSKSKLSSYTTQLKNDGYIETYKYRDDMGHDRLYYKFIG